jgi:hypothetical protein
MDQFCRLTFVYFLILTVVYTRLVQSNNTSPFNNFGNPCNIHKFCNPDSLLKCIGGICQCESPTNQIFDNVTQICLSVVGGQCTLGHDSSSPKRNCIKNAHCVPFISSYYNYTECQCQDGFIENSAGECVPGIGQPCNYGQNECNPLGMVVCKNEKCSCLDELQIYDAEMRRCVSPVGTHCKYDTIQLGCVKNAICYPFYYWTPPRCICKPNYIQAANRTCILSQELKGNIVDGNG